MYNLRRFYNQNRKKIWLIIAVIAFCLILLKAINDIVAEQKQLEASEVTNQIEDVTSSISEDYAVISDEKVEETAQEENMKIIDEFLQACNDGRVEDAYNMLSDACKEVKYSDLDSFVNNYYSMIFTTQKDFNKEAWMQKEGVYTYRIVIIDDPLATGKVSYGNSFQDFYTVVNTEQGQKLNISSFIVREYLDKNQEIENVSVNAKYRDCYMDYEEYVLEVTNQTEKTVVLDSKEKNDSTYLIGENDNKFSSYNSEMSIQYQEKQRSEEEDESTISIKQENNITNNIAVPAKTSQNIRIKFNKTYNPERKIQKIEFSDVIMDYEAYLQLENKVDYPRTTITINL